MADFILIVCGGRGYPDRARVFAALDTIHRKRRVACVVEGGCPTGADLWARQWAKERRVKRRTFPANWKAHGNAAGPIRNREMFAATYGAARGCAAFAGGRGTADCVKAARACGVPVWDVDAVWDAGGAGDADELDREIERLAGIPRALFA